MKILFSSWRLRSVTSEMVSPSKSTRNTSSRFWWVVVAAVARCRRCHCHLYLGKLHSNNTGIVGDGLDENGLPLKKKLRRGLNCGRICQTVLKGILATWKFLFQTSYHKLFKHAFTALHYIFEVITLGSSLVQNQCNYSENVKQFSMNL